MPDIRKLLKVVRAREGLDQIELANQVGVSRSAVANWETLKANMAPEHVEKIVKLYPYVIEEPSLPRVGKRKWNLKLWGTISAGMGNAMQPDLEETYIPSEFDRDDYGGMAVDGDSMMPFLHPSDIVIFRDWRQAKTGHVMACCNDDGDWFVKLMVYEGGRFKLRSLNKEYKDMETDSLQVRGFLVGIIRDNGPERVIRLNPYGITP